MTVTPRYLIRLALLLLAASLYSTPVHAEPQPVQTANYKQALKYSDEFLRQFVYDTAVRPSWIGKTDLFLVCLSHQRGTRYWKVNPKLHSKEPLFDQVKVGTQLSEALQKPLDHQRLPLERVSLNDEGTKLTFVAEEWRFEYDLAADKLTKLGKVPPLPTAPGPNATAEERASSSRSYNDGSSRTNSNRSAAVDEAWRRRLRGPGRQGRRLPRLFAGSQGLRLRPETQPLPRRGR